MIIKGSEKTLTINAQHDYLTLRTPNGNYTSSWSGAKASGKLGTHPTAFNNIDKFIENEKKTKSSLEAMKLLLDPKILSKLWKEWNETVKPNLFLAGDTAIFDPISIFSKKYKGGVVTKVARKTVYLKLATNEVIGFDYQSLIKK
jgi:hypothetical protein